MAGILRRLIQAGGARLAVRAAKSMPIVGTAVAVGLVGYEINGISSIQPIHHSPSRLMTAV
jgi:hypothetical protein